MGRGDAKTTIQQLSDFFYAYSVERGWEAGYNPSFLAKSIVIEAAELLELFQKDDSKLAVTKLKDAKIKQDVSYEIVDILYYLLMLAKIGDIDITHATQEKLKELAKRYPPKESK
jgi:dCTP diphosphatase